MLKPFCARSLHRANSGKPTRQGLRVTASIGDQSRDSHGEFGVITMDMIGKIRRMHFRQNKSVREIARGTGLSRDTVRLPPPTSRHGFWWETIQKSVYVLFCRFFVR